MTNDLLKRYGGPVPRYTSYPTAPHFSADIDAAAYRQHLAEMPDDAPISLYAHIPYCDTLCWFCGCHTKITRQYRPVAGYVDTLIAELELLADAVGSRRMSHMHWGGGSPTLLLPKDIVRLAQMAIAMFPPDDGFEFAVEIDPRETGADRIAALGEAGLTRASIGVQDFDPLVQRAINREQSFSITAEVVDALRRNGVSSLNLDLMYGLPYQTLERTLDTIDQALTLRPDRVALFGYAHVPWMKTHQRMVPEEALPGPDERLRAADAAAARLVSAGYRRIGIDHFALPDDSMAKSSDAGALRRNFQGYTTDRAPALLSVGASAIGRLPDLYVQNESSLQKYAKQVRAGVLPIVRGAALSADDRTRAGVIERLMCDFQAEVGDIPGVDFEDMHRDGLLRMDGQTLIVTTRGRPFVRQIAARFDRYLGQSTARHSAAV